MTRLLIAIGLLSCVASRAAVPSVSDAVNVVNSFYISGIAYSVTNSATVTPDTNFTYQTVTTSPSISSTTNINKTPIAFMVATVTNFFNLGGTVNVTNVLANTNNATITETNIVPLIQSKRVYFSSSVSGNFRIYWQSNFPSSNYSVHVLAQSSTYLTAATPINFTLADSFYFQTEGYSGASRSIYGWVDIIGILNTP